MYSINKVIAIKRQLKYDDAPEGDRSKLLNYFIQNRLSDLMDCIGDF